MIEEDVIFTLAILNSSYERKAGKSRQETRIQGKLQVNFLS